MLSFSACIPRMFGSWGFFGGGVGGTSPVERTRASINALSRRKASVGGRAKSSAVVGRGESQPRTIGGGVRSGVRGGGDVAV